MAEEKSKVIEREYVIPLREKCRPVPRYKKTNKAIKSIKEFVARHMKIYDGDLNKIKVDPYVNEYMWAHGIKNPPQKIKVKAIKDANGLVRVELVDYSDKLKFKKARQEKFSKEALAKVESKKSLKEKVQETMKGGKDKEDKNSDGVQDKAEEKEKEESVKEAGEKLEEEMAKKNKKTAKQEKQPVNKKKEHSKGDDKR